MKIYDCTTFFDEKMIMDLRFNILNDSVHKFVVVESLYSHSGEKKKLNFNLNDYTKFKDKIEYIVIDKEPKNLFPLEKQKENNIYKRLNSIRRIEQSYEYMKRGITDALDDDLIIISDNDEIPNLNSEQFKQSRKDYIILKQFLFYYRFNLFHDKMSWFGSKATKKKKLVTFSDLRNLKNKKYSFWRIDTFFSNIKKINIEIIENGGWHFTNMKSPEDLFIKMKNFGHHNEFDESNLGIADLERKINEKIVFYNHFADKTLIDKWNYNYKLKKIDNELLPEYLLTNQDKYKDWLS